MILPALRQVLGFIALLLGAAVLIFFTLELFSGDPARFLTGARATPEAIAALRGQLGLDLPAWLRFFGWLGGMLVGDFGVSMQGAGAGGLIGARLLVTLPLAFFAILLSTLIGLPLGLLAARRGGLLDASLMGLARLGMASANFWLGMLLLLGFSVGLRWLPAGGFVPWSDPLGALRSLLLPTIALALPQAALLARVTRRALVEVQTSGPIRAARARGLTMTEAMRQHGLRNALLPVLGLVGPQLAILIAGTLVVETVFYLPGLGRLLIDAIAAHDLVLVRGASMVVATLIIGTTFLCGLLRLWVNSRPQLAPPLAGDSDLAPSHRRTVRSSLTIGAIATLAFLVIGFVSVAWTPYHLGAVDVAGAMQGGGAAHWLGTDQLGRDIASQLMAGILTSFVIAAVAAALGALIGVPLGLGAASLGGPFDALALGLNRFLFCFPALLLAVLIAAVAEPGTLTATLAIGIANIPVFALVARSGARELGSKDYIAAARLAGMPGFEIAAKHFMPAIAGLVLAQSVLQLAAGVLAEAALAYFGLGTEAPATSLGLMLRDAQGDLLFKPAVVVPGLAILLIVLALQLLGDGLRDRFDLRAVYGRPARGAA